MSLGLFDSLPDATEQSTAQQGAAGLFDDLPDAAAPAHHDALYDRYPELIRDYGEMTPDGRYSPSGAWGQMQVLPSTAARPGYGVRPAQARTMAEFNRVGVDLARAWLRDYGPALGAAAYNWGPGNLEDALARYGDPRKGEISEHAFLKKIPGEVQHYVRRVMARVPGETRLASAGSAAGLLDGQAPAEAKGLFDDLPDAEPEEAVAPARGLFDDLPDAEPEEAQPYPHPTAATAAKAAAADARTAHGEGLPLLSPEAQQTFGPKQPRPLSPLGRSLGVTPEERNTPLGVVALNRLKSGVSDYAAQYTNDVDKAWTNLTTDLQAAVPDRDKMKAANFWDATKMQVDSYLAAGKSIGDAFALALAPLTAAAHLGTKAQGDFYHALVPSIDPAVVKDAFDRAIIGIGPAKPVPNPAADAFSSATARAFNSPLRLTDQRGVTAPSEPPPVAETPTVKALPAPEPPPGIPTAEVPAQGLAAAEPPQGIAAAIPLPDLPKPIEKTPEVIPNVEAATEPPVKTIVKRKPPRLGQGMDSDESSVLQNIRRMGGIKFLQANGEPSPEALQIMDILDEPLAKLKQKKIFNADETKGRHVDDILGAFRTDRWFEGTGRTGTRMDDLYDLIRKEKHEGPQYHPLSARTKRAAEQAEQNQSWHDLTTSADILGIPYDAKTSEKSLRAAVDKARADEKAEADQWVATPVERSQEVYAERKTAQEAEYARLLKLYNDPLTAWDMVYDNPDRYAPAEFARGTGVPREAGARAEGAGPAEPGEREPGSSDLQAEGADPDAGAPRFREEPGAVDAKGKALPQSIIPGAEQGDAKAQQAATKASRALDEAKLRGQQSKLRKSGQEAAGGMFAPERDQTDLLAPKAEAAAPKKEPNVFERLAAARDQQHAAIKSAFERDGRVVAVSKRDPKQRIVLTKGLQDAPYRVTSFDGDAPLGHRDYSNLTGGSPANTAAFEFSGYDIAEPKAEGTRAAPVTVTAADHMEPARAAVNSEPTEGQKEAGNYAKGHLKYQGHDVTLETPKGSERTGVGKDGKPWSVTMPADYGYIKRTSAADGEQLDVYLGPKPDAPKVFVIDQMDLDTGKFDEHKAMMGFGSVGEARATYEKAFSDGKGRQRIGGVRTLTQDQFKRYLKEGDLTKPASPFTKGATAPKKPTIYQRLKETLGREPTNAELKAEVARIGEEGLIERGSKGQLSHQKKPRRATGGSVERTAMAEPDDDLDGFTRVTPPSFTPAPAAADVNDLDGFTRSSEPAPQTTWGSAAKNFGAGAVEALTGAAAMFSDPGAGEEMGALGLHPDVMPESPVTAQHRLNAALGPANPENIQANTTLEHIARGAGAGVASSVMPGSLPTKIATAGKEILINTLAGAGASAAEEFAPDALKPVAGIAGGVGASLATAPRQMLTAAERAAQRLTVRGRAGQRLVSEATDPDVAMQTLGTKGAIVPGSLPTAGQETGDLGLLKLEREMQTRDPLAFQQRRADQNTARRAELDKLQPEGSAVNLAEHAKNHIQQSDRLTEQEIEDATKLARERMDALGGQRTPEEYGAALREPLAAARKRAKARETALWSAVDPNGDLTINADPVRREAKSVLDGLPKSAKPPSGEELRILKTIGDYTQTIPFSELTALRTSVNDALREELRSAGQSQVYRRLTKMRGAIEDSLSATIEQRAAESPDAFANLFANYQQEVPGQAFDAAARERLSAASASTKSRVATYDKGTTGQILRKGDTADQFRLSDAAVPAKVFMPGPKGAEAVAAYRKAAGDGQALAALQDYAASSLRKVAERQDGTLDPAKTATWMKRHSEALRAFPELQQRFKDAASASEAIAEAALARRTQMDTAQAGAFGRIAKLEHPDDVAKTVGSIFGAKDAVSQMRGLVGRVKADPDALEGLRKAVADHINTNFISNTEAATSGQMLIKSDAFQTFVKKNRAALSEVFSPEQVNSLQAIANDLNRSNRSITAVKIPGQSNTAQDLEMLKHGASFLRRLFEHSSPWAYAGSKVIGALHAVGLDRTDQMVREALLNPKFAKELMSRVPKKSPGSDAMLAARFRRSLMPTAAAVYSGDSDSQ